MYRRKISSSAAAEGDIFEGEGGDDLCLPRVGIVADVAQALPDIEHVACDVHAADWLDNASVLNEETFDAVGEVAGHRVAIATIKVCDEDCMTGLGNQLLHAFSSLLHDKVVNALCGRLHA